MVLFSGVMLAVEAIVENLKKMSKPVTTPEEIAQVVLHQLVAFFNVSLKRARSLILKSQYFHAC